MKKNSLSRGLLTSCMLGLALVMNAQSVFAHGYVETPPARGYQGQLDKEGSLGWDGALSLYGNVITNPQSLEAPKGFPKGGPADGRIASANGGLGQIGDFVLDNQTSDRWKKTAITTGENTFTWHYTAPHKTTKWHYYMTKPGWDQNAPLTRDELELIGTIGHDGTTATNNLSHTITIPENRIGYHVILAVWDVADTANGFYNVIDVNVNNTSIPVIPTKPTNLQVTNITKQSVALTWDAQTTAASYYVYRDGVRVATVKGNQYEDTQLHADTEYCYEIAAVAPEGQISEKSEAVMTKTLAQEAQEKPTAPGNLHSMMVTEEAVLLMWNPASHSAGIKNYEVYRDGVYVATTSQTSYQDTGLKEDTTYRYIVKATSNDGEKSDFSNQLTITTQATTPLPGDERVFRLGSITTPELYTKDEVISYQGKTYHTLVTHYNYGDPSWNPQAAPTLFSRY